MTLAGRWLAAVAKLALLGIAALGAAPALGDGGSWFGAARDRVADVWRHGTDDLYVPLRTHHLRFAYDAEKIRQYDEAPLGIGYGRSKFDRDGDWHGLYVMGFHDSHYKPNYMAGYAYQTFWRPAPDWRLGVGASAFLMTRPDIGHYVPFPGVLPVGSLSYRNFSLETAYLPGGHNIGNILFIWGRYHFE